MPASTEGLLAALLAAVERELPAAVQLRHRLHADPEPAHREHRTSALLAEQLPDARSAAGTGLLAPVGGQGPGAVALRAELDGLPLQERTGASFSAVGETMHACGHDVHMAALVALARAAGTLAEPLPAPMLAVLQPSEEAYPSGARQLARGELAAVRPRAVLAAHVHPGLPWGAAALDAGTVNASCDAFEILVHGRASHGAYPHLGRDPILALSEIVLSLHARAGRAIDPLAVASLTVGVLEAGSAENLIPAVAVGRGALRAHDESDRATLRALVRDVSVAVATAHGCRADVRLEPGEPALRNDPALVARARPLLEAAGLTLAAPWRSCGSDDFAFLADVAPVAMAFVGLDGAPGFEPRPLHHPELLVPDEAVGAVARAMAALYVAAAESG